MPLRSTLQRRTQAAQRLWQRLGPPRAADVLIVADPARVALAQLDPLAPALHADGHKTLTRRFDQLTNPHHHRHQAQDALRQHLKPNCLKVAFLQHPWNQPLERVVALIQALRNDHPNVRVAYLDWVAPLSLPLPGVLPHVDLYLKKQILRDTTRYTQGIRNNPLLEDEANWMPTLDLQATPAETCDPDQLEQKLFLGWNFAMANAMRQQLHAPPPPADPTHGLHCRIAVTEAAPGDWYAHMRRRAYHAAQQFTQRDDHAQHGPHILSTDRLAYPEYLRELQLARVCFSPFGYGEVCWRDFEAAAAHAALIKPNMDHLHTRPNLYLPHETYLPVAHDFHDLPEKTAELLDHPDQQHAMVQAARHAWQDFQQHGWPKLWQELNERLPLTPAAHA